MLRGCKRTKHTQTNTCEPSERTILDTTELVPRGRYGISVHTFRLRTDFPFVPIRNHLTKENDADWKNELSRAY